MRVALGRREACAAARARAPRASEGATAQLRTAIAELVDADEAGTSKRDLAAIVRGLLDGKRANCIAALARDPGSERMRVRLELLNELRGRMREIELGRHLP